MDLKRKRQRQDPTITCQQTFTIDIKIKVIAWKKIYHANANQNKASMPILTSNKAEVNTTKNKKKVIIYND